jgi:hypothetical protein
VAQRATLGTKVPAWWGTNHSSHCQETRRLRGAISEHLETQKEVRGPRWSGAERTKAGEQALDGLASASAPVCQACKVRRNEHQVTACTLTLILLHLTKSVGHVLLISPGIGQVGEHNWHFFPQGISCPAKGTKT